MKFRTCFCLALISLSLSLLVCATVAVSQTAAAPASQAATPPATGTLRGQVTDPSGAAIANASVVMTPAAISSSPISAQANGQGLYEFKGLAAGRYSLTVVAQGFSVYENDNVVITTDQPLRLNVTMAIEVEQQKIQVSDTAPTVDVNPESNAGAITISGKELEALPDDPDELLTDLQALAGPSAGPNGGQLYIDGFTAGQLPPKESIREIRINQNPFSAEFDKIGYGRIEVFTKPGTDKFHGQFSVVGNSSGLNTRNPFLGDAEQEPYDSVIYQGNFGGPINKKSSFFFDVQRRNIDEIAVVNAQVLDSNFMQTARQQSVPNPHTRTNIGTRFDYQVSKNNTLTARYQFYRDTQQNAGVGGLVLPEAGYDTNSSEHTVQISDTQILGTKAVNETHFQYLRENSGQNPLSTALGISVPGDFVSGGSSSGATTDHQDHYELQNYTSISAGKHFVKFGGRLRAIHENNISSAGFNGSYTFPDLTTYADALQGLPGGNPLQYSLSLNATPGNPAANVPVTMVDAGLYVQDDWRVRTNITLSAGLRLETQTGIHDHADWAPRLGFAWGLGGGGKNAPKTVLRGGFGLFYERFTEDLILNADRQNGVVQQQFILTSTPTDPVVIPFPTPPPVTNLPQSIYQINPEVRAPYIMQTAFSLERQITKIANATVTYLNARGVHELLSLNANAPPPGTPYSSG